MANKKHKEDFNTNEKLDEQEKELQEITKRKKFQNKVFAKIINQLDIKQQKK